MPERYTPIHFDSEWMLQKHRGWLAVHHERGLKVLTKAYGVLRRVLVLCDAPDQSSLTGILTHRFAPTSEIVVHDFSALEADRRHICNRPFVLVSDHERLINKATFVIDLSRTAEMLFQSMRQSFRQCVKKAKDANVTVDISETASPSVLEGFVTAHSSMASTKGLPRTSRLELEAMIRTRNLVVASAVHGSARSYAIIYVANQTAFYLLGASSDRHNDASKLLHFEVIKYLKGRGLAWYDLGGVPQIDDTNGIYLFKKGFGGELVRLGAEFVHRPAIVQGLRTGFQALRRVGVAA